VLGGSIVTVMVGSVVWLLLMLATLVRAAGGSVPGALEIFCAAFAAPIALAAAGHGIAAFWRGPTIRSFTRTDSEVCTPDQAAYVRLVALLRGTMGGAGFLFPARLLLPVVAWTTAAAEGVALLASGLGATAFAALALVGVGSATAAVLFPPGAYYYREATGGSALVNPPSAARRLKRRAARVNAAVAAAAGAAGADASLPTPTPTPAPLERSGGVLAAVDADSQDGLL
jgi:hypothetical protein